MAPSTSAAAIVRLNDHAHDVYRIERARFGSVRTDGNSSTRTPPTPSNPKNTEATPLTQPLPRWVGSESPKNSLEECVGHFRNPETMSHVSV
jgi:hypothetical protein